MERLLTSEQKMIRCLETRRAAPGGRLVALRGNLLEALRRVQQAFTQDGVDGVGAVQAGHDCSRAFRQPRLHDRFPEVGVTAARDQPGLEPLLSLVAREKCPLLGQSLKRTMMVVKRFTTTAEKGLGP